MIFPLIMDISCFFECLVTFDWMPEIVRFTFLDARNCEFLYYWALNILVLLYIFISFVLSMIKLLGKSFAFLNLAFKPWLADLEQISIQSSLCPNTETKCF